MSGGDTDFAVACQHCGQPLPEGSRTCWACGQQLPVAGMGMLPVALVGLALVTVLGGAAAFSLLRGSGPTSAETFAAPTPSAGQPRTLTPSASNPPGEWIVQPGDTMLTIAAAVGVSRDELRWWNLERYPSLTNNPMSITVGWMLATEGEPLPQPTTRPTPEPNVAQATPAPPGGASGGGSGGGTAPQPPAPTPPPGSWTQASYDILVGFLDSAESAYGSAASALIELMYFSCCPPGSTPEERAAALQEGALIMESPTALLNGHVAYMASNPAHTCFADAYEVSRQLATRYTTWFTNWYPSGGDSTPEGRARNQDAQSILDATYAFYGTDYYGDCG